MRRRASGALVAGLVAWALAGCASGGSDVAPADGRIAVVASTGVYGAVASAIGGDRVAVTSILANAAQDPHSFEPGVSAQLALSRAQVVVKNGGGYDDWMGTLLAGAGNPDATVLTAVELSSRADSADEHVFYDLPTMTAVARAIAVALSGVDPASAALFAANENAFAVAVQALESRASSLEPAYAGFGVVVTEPVSGYLLASLGLADLTPPEFSTAIEEGTDASPRVFAQTLALFADHRARLLVYTEQTGGAQIDRLIGAATDAGAAVVPVSEAIPAGQDYVSWMTATLDALQSALERASR